MTDKSTGRSISQVGAIGIFLSIFGVWLLVAMFFTPTHYGKITNAVAGFIILAVGVGGILADRRAAAKRAREDRDSAEGRT